MEGLFDYSLWGLFAVGLGILRTNILITALAMLAGKFLRYIIWSWLTGVVFYVIQKV